MERIHHFRHEVAAFIVPVACSRATVSRSRISICPNGAFLQSTRCSSQFIQETHHALPARASIRMDYDAAGFSSFDELVRAYANFCGGPLEKEEGRMIIHRGNPNAKVMVIGEGPSTGEDERGQPLRGEAGQLLDKILISAGFDPERDVYITNLSKRRDKNSPYSNDMNADVISGPYLDYLLQEIEMVNPEIIITCGRIATKALLPMEKQGITKMRGNWYPLGTRSLIPMFHPSFLLRNPEWNPTSPKAVTWQDIHSVRERYDAIVKTAV